MSQINLLPWREAARKARESRFYVVLGMTVFAAIISVVVLHSHYKSKIAYQAKRNAYLQQEMSIEQTELSSLNNKLKEMQSIDTELHFIMGLREKSYQAVQLLDELVRVIPQGVTVKKLMRQENQVTVIGRAASNLEITLLMKNVSKSKLFYNPNLTEITGKENISGEERFFQLQFSQR